MSCRMQLWKNIFLLFQCLNKAICESGHFLVKDRLTFTQNFGYHNIPLPLNIMYSVIMNIERVKYTNLSFEIVYKFSSNKENRFIQN